MGVRNEKNSSIVFDGGTGGIQCAAFCQCTGRLHYSRGICGKWTENTESVENEEDMSQPEEGAESGKRKRPGKIQKRMNSWKKE